MLQTELDRIAQNTKAPDRLRALFQVLGNDPRVVAECVARPALVLRRLYNAYVWDDRHHSELRRRAEIALSQWQDRTFPPKFHGAKYRRVVLKRKNEASSFKSISKHRSESSAFISIELSAESFDHEVARHAEGREQGRDARLTVKRFLNEVRSR